MNPKITDWQGKRVWLVGASSGIGASMATELAKRGAKLALSARRIDKLLQLDVDGALLLPCDVTDVDSLKASRALIVNAWSGIDLVIYLAGDYVPMTAQTFDLAVAERVVDVNFNGAMRLYATVATDLPAGGGIAFVSSVAGYRGLPKALCYGPGKAALIHFAECLYFDLVPKGIGCWVINPGFVATRLTAVNDFSMPALLQPWQAARAAVDSFSGGDFDIHFPKRFTRVMKLLAHLPYAWSFPLIRRLTGV